MQKQQEQPQNEERTAEEYLAAQRAGIEALHIGRATLTQAQQQGEQLDRAQTLADETDYKLQRAARVLRGMTWSGWVANMFSKSVGPPPPSSAGRHHDVDEPPDVYEGLPAPCQETAQCIQNYHANVKVLEACETEEQKATCRIICDDMFRQAMKALDDLHHNASSNNNEMQGYALQFAKDLEILRNRQQTTQQRIREKDLMGTTTTTTATNAKDQLFASSSSSALPSASLTTTTTTTTSPMAQHTLARQQEQDQHLNFISQTLGELGSIATTLNQSISQQTETLEQLDTKSDNIIEKQAMVNRRTERLIQNKSWTPVKPTFDRTVSIRHVKTGFYLAVRSTKGDLCLTPTFHAETCVFGLWKRQGQIFGLKNEFNRKWVGQGLLGGLTCTAGSFGRREEWEVSNNDNWQDTKLVCASAGWGNGGYLLVRRKDFALLLGSNTAQDREHAAVWCIQSVGVEHDEQE